MLHLFLNYLDTRHYPLKIYGNINVLRKKFNLQYNRVKYYYQYANRATLNNHPLSRLVYDLQLDPTMDVFEYYKRIDSVKDYLSKRYDIVSNINVGNYWNNVFYRSNSKEILLNVDYKVDPYDFLENWNKYIPIRCITSNDPDLDFYPMNGTKDLSENSISVYEIDINILMLMYKYWSLYRLENDLSINTNVFISSIVLPRISRSNLDLAIYNRWRNLSNNIISVNRTYRHPFWTTDYRNEIDKLLKMLIPDTKGKPLYINQLLLYIPTIFKTLRNCLNLNMDIYTRQSEWVLWLSRIDDIIFLLEYLGERGRQLNIKDIGKLPYLIRRLENSSSPLYNILPKNDVDEFNNKLEKIKSMVGRR